LFLLHSYRHIPFNLDELALDAAARGLVVAMTDMTLASESIERGVLVILFGPPLETTEVYALNLQPSAMSHPACTQVLHGFAQQAQAVAFIPGP
jgi:LysR family glycine cleavage system transcriptional activator